ncbi:MAG TPA: hypothetical protein PLQ04_04420 [Lachnospiraceae bacterium]|nr:hypothetical protein [Lachnospiraceae bacterium]
MSKKVKDTYTFGYKLLTPITIDQWKELVSYWLKNDPNISVTANFDDQESYMEYVDDKAKGWIFSSSSDVGNVTQQLYVLYLEDKVMAATVRCINNVNPDACTTEYFEYAIEKEFFNYAFLKSEFKRMPEIIAYVASTCGLSCEKDVLPEFLDIPHRFTAADKAIIKRCGIYSNRDEESPIIYVPLDTKGTPVVDVDELSKMMCGAAHVIVPATKRVIEALKPIGFPYDSVVLMNLEGEDAVTFPVKGISTYQVASYVLKRICHGDIMGFDKTIEDLKKVINAASSKRLEDLLEESIAALDEKEKEIERLNAEIKKLQMKVDYLSEHTSIGKTDESMFTMTESAIYAGEVKDMLLKLCVKEYDICKNDPKMRDWRRTYLLKDIIDHNQPSGGNEEIIKALKDTFGTKGAYVTDNMSRAISKYGFEIKKLNGGHNSITLNGDSRLTSVISSTESDNRAMKNFLSNYINKLFR